MAVAGAQAERRDEPRQRRSGAAGRSAGARGAPRTAAVQGADRGARQTLSRVLTETALPATVQGADRSPPGLPPAQPASGGVARFPYQFYPSVGLLYWPSPPAHPSRSTKKNPHKQRELEKCATSTRSESMCGRRSFSSGKARLYGRSVCARGAAGSGLPCRPQTRGIAPRHSLSLMTAAFRLSRAAFSPALCSPRLAIAQPWARDFPRLWELLRLISTAISLTAVLKTPTPTGCKVTTSGGWECCT